MPPHSRVASLESPVPGACPASRRLLHRAVPSRARCRWERSHGRAPSRTYTPHPDPLHEPSLGPPHTRALADHASAQKRPRPPQALPALSTRTGWLWWFSVRHVCCEFKPATTGGADDTPNKIALLRGNSVQLLALPLAVIFKFQTLHQV